MAVALAAVPVRSRRRYSDGDLAVKLRVSHLVESVDFEPHELPPAATLIVRRFADPMPRFLRSDASALVPASAWERAARSGLADLARVAARPVRDAVPPNANAVFFADEAELLACFSRDLLHGEAHSLWWWRAKLRSQSSPPSRSLLEAWRRDILYLPSALAHLAARGDAEWILNTLSSAQARSVLEDLTRAFQIESLCDVFQSPFWSSSQNIPVSSRATPTDVEGVIGSAASSDAPLPAAPPWRDAFGDIVPPRLGRERMALLGVSLVLSLAPRIARSRRFTEDFSRWYRSAIVEAGRQIEARHPLEADGKASNSDPSFTQLTERQSSNAIDVLHNSHLSAKSGYATAAANPKDLSQQALAVERNAEVLPVDSIHAHGALNRGNELAAVKEQPSAEVSKQHGPQIGLNPEIETIAGSDPASHSVLVAAVGVAPSSKVEVLDAVKSFSPNLRQIDVGDGLATELGGVLFLVNVLKSLRLPDSLEEACDCQLGLGGWELIDLIARGMLGHRHTSLLSDPFWTALASLDGRLPEQKAGRHFVPASCYRIPADWIPSSGSGHLPSDFAIRLRGRQLEVWHRFGFPCVVRQFDRPPRRSQIQREIEDSFGLETCPILRHYPRLWTAGRLLEFAPPRPLRRFLSFLLPFIRWRLAAAVGLQTTQRPFRAETFLLRTGRLWVTSTHVDLVMDLGQATGPVRLAGLDADPGWMPELGRVVKFHFR
jgi:hypothetical protein